MSSSSTFVSFEEVAGPIRECAKRVFFQLGRGMTESVYQMALFYELQSKGFQVEREVHIPIRYGEFDSVYVGALRADLVVSYSETGRKIVLEIKAQGDLNEAHVNQLFAYMRNTGNHGMVLNFCQRDDTLKREMPAFDLIEKLNSAQSGSNTLLLQSLAFVQQ